MQILTFYITVEQKWLAHGQYLILLTGRPQDGSIKSAQYPASLRTSQISSAPSINCNNNNNNRMNYYLTELMCNKQICWKLIKIDKPFLNAINLNKLEI